MSITVKDLFQYDSNFDQAKIRRLTGKKDYKKSDIIDLSRLAALKRQRFINFCCKKRRQIFCKFYKR